MTPKKPPAYCYAVLCSCSVLGIYLSKKEAVARAHKHKMARAVVRRMRLVLP